MTLPWYDISHIFGYLPNGDGVGHATQNEGPEFLEFPDGEVHFVMTFKTEDDGYYLIKVYSQGTLQWYGRIKPASPNMSYNFENIWIGRSDFSNIHNNYNGNPTATSISSIYDVKVLRKALTEIEIDKMYTNIDIVTNSKIFYKLNGAVTVSDNIIFVKFRLFI